MSLLTSFLANHKKKLIVVGVLAVIAFGSTFLLGNDNPLEQAAETAIKEETGVDVDFSPEK